MSDEEDAAPEGAYEVGYGKPPLHTRFKPGHKRSKGRPPGSKNTKDLMLSAWRDRRPALVNGKRTRISHREVAVERLARGAGDGDMKAFEKFEKVEADVAERSAVSAGASRFVETADKFAMADIVRRIRNMPAEEPSSPEPEATDEQTVADDANAADTRDVSVSPPIHAPSLHEKPEGSP